MTAWLTYWQGSRGEWKVGALLLMRMELRAINNKEPGSWWGRARPICGFRGFCIRLDRSEVVVVADAAPHLQVRFANRLPHPISLGFDHQLPLSAVVVIALFDVLGVIAAELGPKLD
jgi:hypothetical protein